jgi:hypothetical protein
MLTVTAADAKWEQYAGQREGRTDYKLLARGKAGTPDNYELTIIQWSPEGTYSPRHRHNFEQFRFPLNMPLNYSPNQDVPAGQLGYFPEGAYYGPQRINGGCLALMLQFGGPIGFGFMSYPETRRGSEELKQKGRFEKGIFRYEDDGGNTKNQDGYEAVWEHINGKPIEYVKPRYREAVVIDPEAYTWQPVVGAQGAYAKPFGTFNERGTAAAEYLVEPSAELMLTADGRKRLFFVVEGAALAGSSECEAHTAISLDSGDSIEVKAVGQSRVTLLNFDLPTFQAPAQIL